MIRFFQKKSGAMFTLVTVDDNGSVIASAIINAVLQNNFVELDTDLGRAAIEKLIAEREYEESFPQ